MQYYSLALDASQTFEPAHDALKRLGHVETRANYLG